MGYILLYFLSFQLLTDDTLSSVMYFRQASQSFSCNFGGDVTLWHGEHFIADHKFANGGRAQQWQLLSRCHGHTRADGGLPVEIEIYIRVHPSAREWRFHRCTFESLNGCVDRAAGSRGDHRRLWGRSLLSRWQCDAGTDGGLFS